MAISLMLNTRRQTTIIATATRLPPPYQVRGRNDRLKRVRVRVRGRRGLTARNAKPTMGGRYGSTPDATLMVFISNNLRFKLRFVALLAAAAIALLATACAPGDPAADFNVATFSGEQFRLSQQRGQAIVINFWYPSCPPCREEMPAFQEVWEKYRGRNVQFIGLFVPQGFDTEADARQFVDDFGLTFQVATDTGATIALEYGIEYFPTTYFIDQAGRIARQEISRMDSDLLAQIVEDLLG